jgi:hypothetical protein
MRAGREVALDHGAAHATSPQVDGERQSDRACPDDQNIGVKTSHALFLSLTCAARSVVARGHSLWLLQGCRIVMVPKALAARGMICPRLTDRSELPA